MRNFAKNDTGEKTGMNETDTKGFAGTLVNFKLIDLIQMCCLSHQSLIIHVMSKANTGMIVIRNGEIVHAACEGQKGEEAFFIILLWEDGEFKTETIDVPHEVSISKNHQFLLMEAARLEDERAFPEEPVLPEPPVSTDSDELFQPLRVLIVDDSKTLCRALTDILSEDDGIEVIGTAENGETALKQIVELKPDIVTLDVNMPVMDGSTALKHIMLKSPCPVVILSSLNRDAFSKILEFLRLGAVDFIHKPTQLKGMTPEKEQLITRLKKAATADTSRFVRAKIVSESFTRKPVVSDGLPQTLLVLKSGMGGFAELFNMVSYIPCSVDTSVIAFQDMPDGFIEPIAGYLDNKSNIDVRPFAGDTDIVSNVCLVGNCSNADQFALVQREDGYGMLKNNHSPNEVETERDGFETFLSSALNAGFEKLVVVLLSGAGIKDVTLLKEIQGNGGDVLIQKRSTSMLPPVEATSGSPEKAFSFQEAGPEEILELIQVSAEA